MFKVPRFQVPRFQVPRKNVPRKNVQSSEVPRFRGSKVPRKNVQSSKVPRFQGKMFQGSKVPSSKEKMIGIDVHRMVLYLKQQSDGTFLRVAKPPKAEYVLNIDDDPSVYCEEIEDDDELIIAMREFLEDY